MKIIRLTPRFLHRSISVLWMISVFLWIVTFSEIIFAANSSYSGQAKIFSGYFPKIDGQGVTQSHGGMSVDIRYRHKWSTNWRLQLNPIIQFDALTESNEERFYFEPEALSLDYSKRTTSIRLGYANFEWEGPDFVNPMDITRAKNFMDPLNPQPRSSLGVFHTGEYDRLSWDIAYFPRQTKAQLPGNESPWWPRHYRLPIYSDDTLLLLPANTRYKVLDASVRDRALDHNVGVRMQFRETKWDLSLAAFDGASSPPILEPIINVTPVQVGNKNVFQLQSPIEIQPIYHRELTTALGLTTTLEPWIVRLAYRYTTPHKKSVDVPHWSSLGVLEIERSFDFSGQTVSAIFEHIVAGRDESNGSSILTQLFESSWLVGWRLTWNDRWTWLQGLFVPKEWDAQYVHTQVKWSFADSWQTNWAVDIFSGRKDSPVDAFTKNDRLMVDLVYLF